MSWYTLQTHDSNVSDNFVEYLEKRLRSLERLVDFDSPQVLTTVHVRKDPPQQKSGDLWRVDCTIQDGPVTFQATERGEDMYLAVDRLKDDLSRQIRQHRQKSSSLLRRGGRAIKRMLKRGK